MYMARHGFGRQQAIDCMMYKSMLCSLFFCKLSIKVYYKQISRDKVFYKRRETLYNNVEYILLYKEIGYEYTDDTAESYEPYV